MSQINITEKNIGKYKGNNTIVLLNKKYIPEKSMKEKIIYPNKNSEHFEQNYESQKNNNVKITNIYAKHNIKKEFSHKIGKSELFSNNKNIYNIYNFDNLSDQNISQNNFNNNNQQFNRGKKNKNDLVKNNKNNNSVKKEKMNPLEQQKQEIEKNKILNELKEQKQKDLLKKRKIIENFIEIMIDLEKTYIKMNIPLNNSFDSGKYYILNSEWFKKYIESIGLINIKRINKRCFSSFE